MPFKDKEEHAKYMREYRKKQKEKKKNLNSKPNKISKPKINKPKINKPKNKMTQDDSEFLQEMLNRMIRRRSIHEGKEEKKFQNIINKTRTIKNDI